MRIISKNIIHPTYRDKIFDVTEELICGYNTTCIPNCSREMKQVYIPTLGIIEFCPREYILLEDNDENNI